MILMQVVYEMFGSDLRWLDEHPTSDYHEIDGGVWLHFAQAPSLLITWSEAPAPVYYALSISEKGPWPHPLEVTQDMSGSRLWAPLVGKQVHVAFLDTARQVVRVHSPDYAVYCCSREGADWHRDCMHISASIPDQYATTHKATRAKQERPEHS
jgi:hypothetical protein